MFLISSFQPTTVDTPLDARNRIASINNVTEVKNPYVGQLIYCVREGYYIKVLAVAEKTISVSSEQSSISSSSISSSSISSSSISSSSTVTCHSSGVIVESYIIINQPCTWEDTTIASNGRLVVDSGEILVSNTTVNNGGTLHLQFGGSAVGGVISAGGHLDTFVAATISNINVHSGGYVGLSGATTAENLSISSGAKLTMIITPDININGTYAGSSFIVSSAVLSRLTVDSDCDIKVESGGTATVITVKQNGYLSAYGGGIVTNATVVSGGRLYASSGVVQSASISYSGVASAYAGGVIMDTEVNYGGLLSVAGEGTATNIIENGGCVSMASGADVTFASHLIENRIFDSNFQSTTVHSGTTANSITLNSGVICVYSGGSANNITVNNWQELKIFDGGLASNTLLNGGNAVISGAGLANFTTISRNCTLYVSSAGIASGVTVSSGGILIVYSGGTATAVTSSAGAHIIVSSGGIIEYV